MTHKIFSTVSMFLLLLVGMLQAQPIRNGNPGFTPAGIPRIECSVALSRDSLYFSAYDYSPNFINATVWVKNVSTAVADTIIVSMMADTRFVIVPPTIDTISYGLQPGDSVMATFRLNVAWSRDTSGYDIVRAVATASNGANAVGEKAIWVEKERYPIYSLVCTKNFGQIVFSDSLNGYVPDPFQVQVEITNIGDGNSEETRVSYLGTKGVDPASFPIVTIGTLKPGERKVVTFDMRAIKRINDTTVTMFFEVQGNGGYKKKTYWGNCQQLVTIPMAKKAEYQVYADVVPTIIRFQDHKYTPDPFLFTADSRNIGNAVGDSVRIQVVLPPSIQLASGESGEKWIGTLDIDSVNHTSWLLRPNPRTKQDTVTICVRVFDRFGNQAVGCDSVIVEPVLMVALEATCSLPDSIHADKLNGTYTNNPFDAKVTVRNIGSDYADSVKATIIIQSPDVILFAPLEFTQKLETISSTGSDKLYPDSIATFTWSVKSLPRGISGMVKIKFKVEAINAETQQPECEVYIPNLEAPALETSCSIDVDSLHYNPVTGGYKPAEFFYTLKIWNAGGGKADSVKATLALPPRVLLGTGETLEKWATPLSLGPKDTAIIVWKLVPLERHDFGSLATVITVTQSTNVEGTYPCDKWVFIPSLPNTSALSITKDNVGYTGQTIYVPVNIDQSDGKDIKSFAFGLRYNVDDKRRPLPQRVVDFAGIEQRYSKTDGWAATATPLANDSVYITLTSNGEALTGASPPPLLYLVFKAVFGGEPGTQLQSRATVIAWPTEESLRNDLLINNGAIFPRVKDGDGMIYISGDCIRPLSASDKYFFLGQNSPNPFNPSTSISYHVAERTHVRIVVLDALGREVSTLVNEPKDAGMHQVVFNAGSLPSGLYFYRMEAANFNSIMKMMLAK